MAVRLSSESLLIIGGGVEQVPLYRRAREMGFSIVGTDVNPQAPGLALADHALIASTRSPEETIEALRNYGQTGEIKGVITIANDVPMTVSRVANFLGLPSIPEEVAKIFMDKREMKARFREGSIPTPHQWESRAELESSSLLESQKNVRFIVKPTDGRGSLGVLVAMNRAEIPGLVSQSEQLSGSQRIIIEEYVEGRQFSVEGIVVDSVFHLAGVAERNYEDPYKFAPHVIENGGDIAESQDLQTLASFRRVMQSVTDVLGLKFGPLKGDLVMDFGGVVQVIEIAGRLSGGWLASHQIPWATGIDLMGLSVLQALGHRLPEENLHPSRNRATSIRYWFPPAGQIEKISGMKEVRRSHGVLHCEVFKKEGDYHPKVEKHSDRFGFVLAGGQTLGEARMLNKQAMSKLRVEIRA